MPLVFENLRKYPLPYFLFLCITAIVYLYFHDNSSKNEIITNQNGIILQGEKDKAALKNEALFLDSLLRDCMSQKRETETIKTLNKK